VVRLRLLVPTVVAVAFGLLAAPALAAPLGDCLWDNSPKASQDGYIQRYRDLGVDALDDIQFGDDLIPVLKKCGVGTSYDEAFKAGAILGTKIFENGAETVALEKAGLARGEMARSWDGLSASDRATFMAFVRSVVNQATDGAATDAALAIFQREAERLKLAEPVAIHLLTYYMARGTREVLETGGLPKTGPLAPKP
jgi:hypothetical protein